MAIQSGTHVGPYEIVSAIGAGGMGEVYRARDSKLGRDVAIKVLPEAFARDADRMARFQREAKVFASLSHPNIATIYGLEDSGSTRALVMELVEGSTLADRIEVGPVAIDEALPIAKQIWTRSAQNSVATKSSPRSVRAERAVSPSVRRRNQWKP